MRIKKSTVLNAVINTLFYIIGSLIYSAGINIFALPNNIAEGGVTGLAIIANYWTGVPVGIATFLFNIPLFILAWIYIGRRFVLKTFGVVALLSASLDLSAMFYPTYTGDSLLASLFCGALTGFGLALILIRGATSGGTDIAAMLLQKLMPQVRLGSAIALCNTVVVCIAAVAFKSVESAMYAVVVIVVSSKVLDYILYGLGKGKLLLVITERPNAMADAIMKQVGRGVSVVPITGAYTGEERRMLVVAIQNNDTAKINKILKTIDDKAFTIITEAGQILGQGFKNQSDFV